jgi:hypothetical protein
MKFLRAKHLSYQLGPLLAQGRFQKFFKRLENNQKLSNSAKTPKGGAGEGERRCR